MRTRSFDTDSAVDAALLVFRSLGYAGASLADLETATGLSRSSIYQAFGSKRGLYEAALEREQAVELEWQLAELERPGAGLRELRSLLAGLAERYRGGTDPATLATLLAGATGETGASDAAVGARARYHQERLERALANALRGAATNAKGFAGAERTARLLAVWMLGIQTLAKVDPPAAAARCDELAEYVAGRW